MSKTPVGRLPPEAIRLRELPRLPDAVLAGYRALTDLTGSGSDAMDELGIAGTIPASALRPTDPSARLVGQALTVRHVRRRDDVATAVATLPLN